MNRMLLLLGGLSVGEGGHGEAGACRAPKELLRRDSRFTHDHDAVGAEGPTARRTCCCAAQSWRPRY